MAIKTKNYGQKIAHGAAGIAKATLGINRPSREFIVQRTAICNSCPQAVLHLGVIQQCKLCGCSTFVKLRIKSEKCPLNQW